MAEKRLELKAGQRVMVRGPDAPGPIPDSAPDRSQVR